MTEEWSFWRKPETLWCEEVKQKFLDAYASTGLFTHSARAAGVAAETARRHLKKDPLFSAEFEEARGQFKDKLEKEIHRRSIDGYDEPIFNTKTGMQIGVKRIYSDRLIELAAKKHIPEYRDKFSMDATVNAGVLVVGGTMAKDAWLAKYGGEQKTGDEPLPENVPSDKGKVDRS